MNILLEAVTIWIIAKILDKLSSWWIYDDFKKHWHERYLWVMIISFLITTPIIYFEKDEVTRNVTIIGMSVSAFVFLSFVSFINTDCEIDRNNIKEAEEAVKIKQ